MREKSARALIRAIVVVDAMLAVARACADGNEERMGARRCGDEDDCLTVYAHECMWMTSIVVFISDVWNILSSYICFL